MQPHSIGRLRQPVADVCPAMLPSLFASVLNPCLIKQLRRRALRIVVLLGTCE